MDLSLFPINEGASIITDPELPGLAQDDTCVLFSGVISVPLCLHLASQQIPENKNATSTAIAILIIYQESILLISGLQIQNFYIDL